MRRARDSARRVPRSFVPALAAAVLAGAAASPASAQGVPLWQRLLRWASGESSATTVPTTMMGTHMQMSVRRPVQPGDEARAQAIVAAAGRVLARYADVAAAERDGYRPFAPRHVIGEEVHYTNYWIAGREANRIDHERPGSILYKRTAQGLQAIGVMYTAKGDAGPEALDARAPLSHAVWHRHVHFCGWPEGAPRHEFDGPQARFGFAGSIHTEAACTDAGGYWVPVAFGWMTHVYPHESDAERVWLGEHAMEMAVEPSPHAPEHGHGGGHRH